MKIIEFQSLSNSDLDAILSALPLIFCSGFEVSEMQQDMNLAFAENVTKKLINHQDINDPNEWRVLCIAVLLAHQHLTGKRRLDLDAETQAELSKHFFAYNKLAPSCDKMLETLEEYLGSVSDLHT